MPWVYPFDRHGAVGRTPEVVAQGANGELPVVGPRHDEGIQGVLPRGEANVRTCERIPSRIDKRVGRRVPRPRLSLSIDRPRTRAADRFVVLLEPAADLQEDLRFRWRNGPVSLGAMLSSKPSFLLTTPTKPITTPAAVLYRGVQRTSSTENPVLFEMPVSSRQQGFRMVSAPLDIRDRSADRERVMLVVVSTSRCQA